MIKADFFKNSDDKLLGFSISGHADYGEEGFDIACASVSSAVMLTANSITEVFKISAKVRVLQNEILLKLPKENDEADKLLLSLLTHLYEISSQFPGSMKITVYDR